MFVSLSFSRTVKRLDTISFIVFLTEAINTMKYEKCFIFKIL